MPLTYEDLTFCCEIQAIASLKYLSVSWETTLARLRLVVMFPNNCCSIALYVCWNCSTLWGCAKKGKKLQRAQLGTADREECAEDMEPVLFRRFGKIT